jgi:cytochrome P450
VLTTGWLCCLQAAHPDIQEQIFAELAAAGLTQRGFAASDWGRLPLLAAVIKEALRLCPPVPFGGCRQVVTPGGAELCGHHVPR